MVASGLITIVRILISDFDTPPIFDDDRISDSIVVGGLISAQEFDYSVEYTFDIGSSTITPDPLNPITADPIAVALFTLKSACILNTSSYQDAVLTSIRVRDGDSEVDTTTGFRGFRDILELGPCESYNRLLKEKKSLQSMSLGAAIATPFVHLDSHLVATQRVERFFNSIAPF